MSFPFHRWALVGIVIVATVTPKSRGMPFRIDAEGQPMVVLPRLATLPDPVFTHISLRHELVHDGLAYSSRIYLPELQSYLVRLSATSFKWRNPAGDTVMLRPDVASVVDGRRLLLNRLAGGEYVVHGDTTRSYWYRDSALRRVDIGPYAYEFRYADGELESIERARPNRSTLARVHRSANGTISTIEIQGAVTTLTFDEGLRLLRATSGMDRPPIVTFEYDNGLMTRASWGGEAVTFRWGGIVDQYAEFALPHPPVVEADDNFQYRIADDGRGVRIYYRGIAEKTSGDWYFDRYKRQLWMNGQLVPHP